MVGEAGCNDDSGERIMMLWLQHVQEGRYAHITCITYREHVPPDIIDIPFSYLFL